MKLNVKFKASQRVECTVGSHKGSEFIICKVIEDAYLCKSVDEDDSKNYRFTDQWLRLVTEGVKEK